MSVKRPLGANEKMTWLLDQAAPMNFVIVAQIEGCLDLQIVEDSLEALIQQHPLLATRIELYNNEPWVVTTDKAKPCLKIIERKNDEQWQLVAESELNKPFECYTGPLLRVTLLYYPTVSELLFTFYHSISDANSGIYVLRDFLTLVGNSKPGAKLMFPSPYPVRPAVEQLLPPAAHGWSKVYKTVKLVVKQIINNVSDHPRKLSVIATPRDQRHTKVIYKILPKEIVDRFVAKCHDHRTTVHGALCASLLLAISRKIESGSRLTLSCCSVVNLRDKLCPPLADEIGMLASGVITAHKLRPTPQFWTLAQEIKQQVYHAIDTGEIYITMTLVGNLIPQSAPPHAFADKMKEVFPYATIVTNIGKVQIPEQYGALQVKKLHFAVSLKSLAGEEFNLAVATFAERLHLNFIYTAPNLADEIANQIADDTIAILLENIEI